jgi:hypothetical protein
MIIIKLKGGLGNQLFQYAFGRFLAEKNKDILKIDIEGLEQTTKDTQRKFLLEKFNISSPIAEIQEIEKIKYPFGFLSKIKRGIDSKIFRKFHVNFEPELLKLNADIYLDGFFQSELYFKNIEDIIRKELTLKDPLSPLAQEFANQIKSNSQSVSIHIRRGDYVSNSSAHKHHGTCDIKYYKHAILKIKESVSSPAFFIFSDDIEWVKENLKIDDATYVSNPNLTECEELLLMSYCSHNIIANSTFSWWGAWLNQNENKIVIAPQKWLNTDISKQPDIIPSTWIKI